MYNKESHKATCADCGKECEVPFKPDAADQCTAENATPNEDHHEDTKLTS